MNEEKGTSWVADARRLLQEFVRLEMRAITARLDASDKQDAERDKVAAERHAALLTSNQERDKVAAERYAALLTSNQERDKVAAERHAAVFDKLEGVQREMKLQLELEITKSKLEAQAARTSPPQ